MEGIHLLYLEINKIFSLSCQPICNSAIGTGGNNNSQSQVKLQAINLIDLLHDGFYLIFLIRNQYVPADPQRFREKILDLLNRFEQQAKKLQFSADDIHDAKYAFCALIDETIVTQQDPSYFNLQNSWLISPLQLSLFGSQLAGYQFFEILEQLRSRGKERLAALEVFHYCLLLGFQGKYRIESIESLNHLVARVGDEIDYLKGKKVAFSPFSAIPDQIRNIIHRELPFFWILIFLLIFALLTFAGLRFMLNNQNDKALSNYQNVISAPQEQAHITIYLP
ncbi:type IVB secretion system protein IcmH/DotU [Acinetobacter baumannii]